MIKTIRLLCSAVPVREPDRGRVPRRGEDHQPDGAEHAQPPGARLRPDLHHRQAEASRRQVGAGLGAGH